MTGRVIAAWPSFALIGSYELLMRQIRATAAALSPRRPRLPPPRTRTETSQPFTLQVRPASAGTVTIHGMPSLQPLFDKWAAARQRELNPPPPAPPPEAADRPARGFQINPAFEQVAAAAATFRGMFTEPDRRTDAEIQREVEQYIQDSREYFGRLAVSRQVEHGYCLMSLELVNGGERSYADLHVEVQLSGRLVANNPEDLSPPGEPPEAPAPAGARRIKLPLSGSTSRSTAPAPGLANSVTERSHTRASDPGGGEAVSVGSARGSRSGRRVSIRRPDYGGQQRALTRRPSGGAP
jgi:hypothetical protein